MSDLMEKPKNHNLNLMFFSFPKFSPMLGVTSDFTIFDKSEVEVSNCWKSVGSLEHDIKELFGSLEHLLSSAWFIGTRRHLSTSCLVHWNVVGLVHWNTTSTSCWFIGASVC